MTGTQIGYSAVAKIWNEIGIGHRKAGIEDNKVIADFISKIMNDLMKPAHFALKIGTAHTVIEKKMEQLLAGTFLTNVVLTICELNRDNVQLYSRYRP